MIKDFVIKRGVICGIYIYVYIYIYIYTYINILKNFEICTRNMYKQIHRCIAYNSKTLETAHMSIKRRDNKLGVPIQWNII